MNIELLISHPTLAVRLDSRNRLVLSILLIATFVVFLNETILGVALPQIMKQLSIEASTGQWLTTAYMLTMAIVIPITGFLLQRFTTRQMFITAMLLFCIGTLFGALAPDFTVLLVGRVIQAASTAIMLPLIMTSVMELVPEAIRGKIMGTISIVMSVAPAIGPAVSGLVLSVLDWRWLFWLILPLALTVLIVGMLKMSNVGEQKRIPVDVLSVVLSAFAFAGVIYGLSEFAQAARGDATVSPFVFLGVGAVALAAFIWRQLYLARAKQPLLDFRVFRSRIYTFAVLIMALAMLTLFGLGILTPIYAQNALGVSALTTGLLLLPGGLLMGLSGPLVGRLYDRVGPRVLIVPGTIAASAAMWFMTTFGEDTSIYSILVANIVLSVGLAFLFTPLFTVSMSSVPPQFYSHSSAIIGTVQQLAGAAGTALFITIMTTVQVNETATGSSDVSALTDGIHWAFVAGAIASTFMVVLAPLIGRVANTAEMDAELAP